MNDWLKDHVDDYSHILLTSDDLVATPAHIDQLIEDVSLFDLQVSGCCNRCIFDGSNVLGPLCSRCLDGKEHETTNITFLPVNTAKLTGSSYAFISYQWAKTHQFIHRVWFQGNALSMISKDTWRKVPFRSWCKGKNGLMLDLAFAEDLAKINKPQFTDFRVMPQHLGTHHGRLLVGKEASRIDFEAATNE